MPDPQGRGTVLRVVYAHHEDGETLALKLAHVYALRPENGEDLPEQLTLPDLMQLLGELGAACAEGWHESANEPTEASWNLVWPWAQAEIRRLLPDVSWKVEHDRRIVMPWDSEGGAASPSHGAREAS